MTPLSREFASEANSQNPRRAGPGCTLAVAQANGPRFNALRAKTAQMPRFFDDSAAARVNRECAERFFSQM
jgi:hypothetical protein